MAHGYDSATYKKLLLQCMGEADPLYAMLEWVTERMMELEAEVKVGTVKGKHSSERATHCSGTQVRRFDTRMGTLYLLVPKLRQGGYIPFFVAQKTRCEQALIKVMQDTCINGVSTLKIERLARSLGSEGISAGQVSVMAKDLNEQVARFRTRPLQKEYPLIWVDAVYEKIRCDGRVVSMAVLVVAGVTRDGRREILACEPMMNESEETSQALFTTLKERGLQTVWLCVSNAHKGLKNAVQKAFLGCSWQRCTVHFMRNILAHVPHREKGPFAEKLKAIWIEPTREAAMRAARILIEEFRDRFPRAIETPARGP